MIFRQLFDPDSSTYTYLLADEGSREAVLIDPVREQIPRDRQILEELGLTLRYTLETHVHADHVTASGLLRQALGSRSAISARSGSSCADILLQDGDTLSFGAHRIEARQTPGHTDGCISYYLPEQGMIFTGDALLIRGCGRTDFQQGDAATLYRSIHGQIFSLPDEVVVWPGHDYQGRSHSTVGEERAHNPRLGGGRSLESFVALMGNLNLAHPRQMHIAVPANLGCGLPPTSSVSEVTPEWTAARRGEVRLVDVRQPSELEALPAIPGAELVPLDALEAAAAGWPREEPLVLICRSGARSGRAATLLEGMGFRRVASMAGGMLAWQQEGRYADR